MPTTLISGILIEEALVAIDPAASPAVQARKHSRGKEGHKGQGAGYDGYELRSCELGTAILRKTHI